MSKARSNQLKKQASSPKNRVLWFLKLLLILAVSFVILLPLYWIFISAFSVFLFFQSGFPGWLSLYHRTPCPGQAAGSGSMICFTSGPRLL